MTSEVKFGPVLPDDLPAVWPLVEPYLHEAAVASQGRWLVEDIKSRLDGAEWMLWVAHVDGRVVGAVVTSMVTYPLFKNLGIQFLGGEIFSRWREVGDQHMVELARRTGCRGIEFVGREGWGRRLADLGYKTLSRTYYKDV